MASRLASVRDAAGLPSSGGRGWLSAGPASSRLPAGGMDGIRRRTRGGRRRGDLGQALLREDLHRPIDRDAGDAGLPVDPSVRGDAVPLLPRQFQQVDRRGLLQPGLRRLHRGPAVTGTTLTALTRHFTLPAPHPQGTTPPRQTAHRSTGNRAAAEIPTKSPHHTRLTGPASTTRTSPRRDIFRWSEARLASSRDRTRTYNLPVNRSSVTRHHPDGHTTSARSTCIRACQGLHHHASSRAAVCRVVPSCPWVFCGGYAATPDLWGFVGSRTEQVRQVPVVKSKHVGNAGSPVCWKGPSRARMPRQ